MRSKPFIKANLYIVTDIMLAIALLLFVTLIFEKDEIVRLMTLGASAYSIGIASFFATLQIFQGKTTVKNLSQNTIYAKLENGSDTFAVNPKKKGYDIDEIKINDVVYQVGTSCHTVVRKDGSIKVKSFTGKIINKILEAKN